MVSTRESLLGRLREENAHEAWKEFYEMYWGAILRYARKLGLDETQARDVLQETMVALMRILPEFAYDRRKGKFRNFLLTIVHRKSLATLRRAKRSREEPLTAAHDERTGTDADRDGLADTESITRWRESLAEEAVRRVRAQARADDRTLAVFEAYVIRHRPAAEVAREFGLTENAVYQIRNRVLRSVRAEMAKMEKSAGGP